MSLAAIGSGGSRVGGLSKIDLRRQREIGKLEQDLSVDQQGSLLERATRTVLGNPVVRRVLDVVSRPNYAIAGAYEEIASSHGIVSAGQRIFSELFSGIGGLEGQKQGFGEVFQDLGYGAGGSLSSVVPFAFSETGEGPAFKRHGFFDWTARGAIGLALDIVTDPTTYLTIGTAAVGRQSVKAGAHYLSEAGVKSLGKSFKQALERGLTQGEADNVARKLVEQQINNGAAHLADKGGIKLFGITVVPGEVLAKPARSVSDGVVKFMHKTSLGESVLEIGEGLVETGGRMLNRDFKVRKLPEYVARKRLYLSELDNSTRNLVDMTTDLFRGTTAKQRAEITNYVDSGGKTSLSDPSLAHIAKKIEDIQTHWAVLEQKAGLLHTVARNYILHAFKESPRKVDEILARFEPSSLKAHLKGSQLQRTYQTLEEARKAGLTPIEDAAELLRRRGMRHVHAIETHRFFTDVANQWGIKALPKELETSANVISEMNDIIAALSKDEIEAVGKASRAGVPLSEVRALSEGGRKLFLAQRFERVQNKLEMENVLKKYDEFKDLFPETTNQGTRMLKSYNGEPMAKIRDIPEFKEYTLPVDIARDIEDFNKHFINREEVAGFLRVYDKLMNGFKVGVTSIFPAFHFRNAYSNLVQQFTDLGLSALNPEMHKDAIRMLAGDVSGSFTARHGRLWGYSEVVYEAKRRGVIADYRNIFETVGDKIPIRSGTAKDFVRHPIDRFKWAGGIIENEGRLAAFTNYLRRGLDPATAAERVNKVLFDYKNLSKFERDFLTRLFPFYRWTRKNIALQAERLIRNPGQAAIQAKLTRHNRTDRSLLPSYLRGDFVFTLDADKDGKLQYIRGIDLPITDLNIIGEPISRLTSDLAPLPKLILELGADQDFFRKQRISENSMPLVKGLGPILELLPQRAKNVIEFSKRKAKDGTTEYRMNSTLTYVLIKSWAISRLYGTADRVLRSKSVFSKENFLDLGTGIRLQDVDVDIQSDRLEREYQAFLEKKAVARGIRRRFQKTYTPKQ